MVTPSRCSSRNEDQILPDEVICMSHDSSRESASPVCAQCGLVIAGTVMMPCYRLRNCPFGDGPSPEAECPAHARPRGCWEVDWPAYFADLPIGAGRHEWRQAMLDACPECEVFALHRDVMSAMIERLRDA